MSRKRLISILGTLAVLIAAATVLNLVGGGNALGTVAAHAGSSYVGIGGLVFLEPSARCSPAKPR